MNTIEITSVLTLFLISTTVSAQNWEFPESENKDTSTRPPPPNQQQSFPNQPQVPNQPQIPNQPQVPNQPQIPNQPQVPNQQRPFPNQPEVPIQQQTFPNQQGQNPNLVLPNLNPPNGPSVVSTVPCPCSVLPNYNPVCGSNGISYSNSQVLNCHQQCGVDVTIKKMGLCTGRT